MNQGTSTIFSQLESAANLSTGSYGVRVPNCPVDISRGSLPKVSELEFDEHSRVATALAEAYSKSDGNADAFIQGHAKAAIPIFQPLAKLIEALRVHRSSATAIENVLPQLRSALRTAFKPLVDAATSADNKPINERSRLFFEKISLFIKQATGLDFDFLMHFRGYNPDAQSEHVPAIRT